MDISVLKNAARKYNGLMFSEDKDDNVSAIYSFDIMSLIII